MYGRCSRPATDNGQAEPRQVAAVCVAKPHEVVLLSCGRITGEWQCYGE